MEKSYIINVENVENWIGTPDEFLEIMRQSIYTNPMWDTLEQVSFKIKVPSNITKKMDTVIEPWDESFKVKELQNYCRTNKISGFSGKKKDQLQNLIKKHLQGVPKPEIIPVSQGVRAKKKNSTPKPVKKKIKPVKKPPILTTTAAPIINQQSNNNEVITDDEEDNEILKDDEDTPIILDEDEDDGPNLEDTDSDGLDDNNLDIEDGNDSDGNFDTGINNKILDSYRDEYGGMDSDDSTGDMKKKPTKPKTTIFGKKCKPKKNSTVIQYEDVLTEELSDG